MKRTGRNLGKRKQTLQERVFAAIARIGWEVSLEQLCHESGLKYPRYKSRVCDIRKLWLAHQRIDKRYVQAVPAVKARPARPCVCGTLVPYTETSCPQCKTEMPGRGQKLCPECRQPVPCRRRVCKCGYKFTFTISAYKKAVLADELVLLQTAMRETELDPVILAKALTIVERCGGADRAAAMLTALEQLRG